MVEWDDIQAGALAFRAKLRKYRLTLEQYASMITRQKGVCAICGNPDHRRGTLSIDHDHVSGRVRGLLCVHCNLMLGHAKDNPDILKAAVAYLEAYVATV